MNDLIEIKPSLKVRIQNFIVLHPILLAFIISLFVMLLFGGCDRAKASEMDLDSQTYVISEIENANNYNDLSSLLSFVFSNYPYYLEFVGDELNGNTYVYNGKYFVFYLNEKMFPYIVRETSTSLLNPLDSIGSAQWSGSSGVYNGINRIDGILPTIPSFSGSSYYWVGLYYNLLTNNITAFGVGFGRTGSTYRSANVYNLDNEIISSISYIGYSSAPNSYSRFLYNPDGYSSTYIAVGGRIDVAFDEYFSNHYLYIASGTYNSDTISKCWLLPEKRNISEMPSQTEGLKVYKRTLQNQNSLVVDFSDLISISQAVSNSSTLALTINVDGSDTVLNFDSESDYYYYNTSLQKAYYQFSYNALGLTGDIDYAYVSSVTVNNTTSSPGGSSTETFFYLDLVTLIGTPPSNGYEDEEIEQFEYNDIIDATEMETINEALLYAITSSTGGNNGIGLGISSFPYSVNPADNLPSWADITTFEVWAPVYGTFNQNERIDRFYLEFNSSLSPYFFDQDDILSEVFKYSAYYDIVIIKLHTVPSVQNTDGTFTPLNDTEYGSYYTTIYGVFVSDRYYEHFTSSNIFNLLKYSKNIDTNLYLTYDYLKQRLDNMNSNMVEYFKTSSDKLNSIIGLLESLNNSLPDLNNLLNRILNTLLNLNISSPDIDIAPVISRLDSILSIMNNHNEIDTIQECIDYYEEHSQGGLPSFDVWLDNMFSVWLTGRVHSWIQDSNPDINESRGNIIVRTFDVLSGTYDDIIGDNFNYISEYLGYLTGSYSDSNRSVWFSNLFDYNFDITSYSGVSGH